MKIAIVSGGFFETSVPLANAFAERGYEVDMYCICQHPDMFVVNNAFEYQERFAARFIQEVKNHDIRGMQFISSERMSTYLVCYNLLHTTTIIGKAVNSLLWPFILRLLIKRFEKKSYDYIAVIGHYFFLYELSILLNNTSIVHSHSLHEVVDHAGDGHVFDFVHYLHDAKVPLVLHSNNLIQQLKNKSFECENMSVIPFGPCYGYKDFNLNENGIITKLQGEKYMLSYGYISKYKGYELLWHSYEHLKNNGGLQFKIVVAGKGYDSYVEEMKRCDDFIVINRFIGNDELATLISHAIAVLCPYSSVSQSGIPQTCMVFETPVIATDIGAFREVIIPGKNGVLSRCSAEAFANAMMDVWNKGCYKYNIPKDYLWSEIIKQYETLINEVKSHDRQVKKKNILRLYLHDVISRVRNKNKIGG